MASKKVVSKKSAMSHRQKITTLTQECFRRLHNTSDDIDENVKIVILNEFMESLTVSGYSESERLSILEGGLNTFKKLKDKETVGIRPFFRSNKVKKELQRNKNVNNVNKKKSLNWFQKGTQKYATVMFVEATEGDRLLKLLKETEDKFKIADHMRIKFISKTGPKLIQMFQRKDPFKGTCGENDCIPCVQSVDYLEKPPNCRKNNIAYSAQCIKCDKKGIKRVYYGETCRNLYLRSKEHYSDVISKKDNSWMYRHTQTEHKGDSDETQFKWKILGSFTKPLRFGINTFY